MYHYTSVDGFDGIIRNKSLRMTKSEFLNDPSDCKLFNTIIQNYLDNNNSTVTHIINNTASSPLVRNFSKNYPISTYIDYIQNHIPLYVLSLTELKDDMNMWNYYGHGGIELELRHESLINSIISNFTRGEEFLTCSKVIYTDESAALEDITVPVFDSFELKSQHSDNQFATNRTFIDSSSEATYLYDTHSLDKFIKTYIKNYVYTIKYLDDNHLIDASTDCDELFEKIFNNINSLYGKYSWKRDLSLYILVLSALIKNNTYEYENEYRVVYFEHNLSTSKAIKENYYVRSINSNKYLHPYIEFSNLDLAQNISAVTISPITKNIPINPDAYTNNISNFLISNQINCPTIEYSHHKIRW